MAKFEYENQGFNTYLIYELEEGDELDMLSLGMITNNNINGFAPVLFTQMNHQKYVKYNISAKVSMKQFITGIVTKKKLLGVFSSILEVLIAAEDYMIDPDSILLDFDYIYIDVSINKANVICLPIINIKVNQIEYQKFFKNIVFNAQFDQTENCDYVAIIINYLNSAAIFSLVDFKNLIDGQLKADIAVPKQKSNSQPTPQILPYASQQQQNGLVMQNNIQKIQSLVPDISVQNGHLKPAGLPVSQQEASQTIYNTPPVPQTLSDNKKKKSLSLFNKTKSPKDKPKKIKQVKKQKDKSTAFAIPTPLIPGSPPVPMMPMQKQQTTPSDIITPEQKQPNIYQQVPTQYKDTISKSQGNFGETTVLGGGHSGETTILDTAAAAEITPYIIRMKNNEKIKLTKPVFRIGKEKSYVDYFIGDNSAVSRSHANIISRESECYLLDTNSTNHTYINGVMLQSNVEAKLSHGTKFRLANEEFEFRIY